MEDEHTAVSILKVIVLIVHHVLFVKRLSNLVLTVFTTIILSIAITSTVSHFLMINYKTFNLLLCLWGFGVLF